MAERRVRRISKPSSSIARLLKSSHQWTYARSRTWEKP